MQKRYSQSNQVNTGPGVTLTLYADDLGATDSGIFDHWG